MILKLLVGSVQSACQGWLVERKEGWGGAGVGEKVDKEKNFLFTSYFHHIQTHPSVSFFFWEICNLWKEFNITKTIVSASFPLMTYKIMVLLSDFKQIIVFKCYGQLGIFSTKSNCLSTYFTCHYFA